MKDVRVASIQFNHKAGDKNYNLAVIKKFVEKGEKLGAEIIVFPEMCITGYWHVSTLTRKQIEDLSECVPDGASAQALLCLSKRYNVSIGAGIIERDDQGSLYNTYLFAMPDGRIEKHRKLHTFVSPYMSSGHKFTVFDTPQGCKVGILICWDNNLVENVRITALMGADILIAPHQTGGCNSRSPKSMGRIEPSLWYNRQKSPDLLRAEMQGDKGRNWLLRWLPSRAHDNGIFIIFSNGVGLDVDEVRTGNAMILSPYGEILAETDSIEDDMVMTDLKAEELRMCTGRRWIRGRRPELYTMITQSTGCELKPYDTRFSDDWE